MNDIEDREWAAAAVRMSERIELLRNALRVATKALETISKTDGSMIIHQISDEALKEIEDLGELFI